MTPEEQQHVEAYLSLLSGFLDDIEGLRISINNRLKQAVRDEPDKDGRVRGFGLDYDAPEVQVLVNALDGMQKIERSLIGSLEKLMRKHPLGGWVRGRKGIGEKTIARLLGTIGDPYLRTVHGEDGLPVQQPRSLRQLYAYCGMHVTPEGYAPVRRKGVKSNWNENARKVLFTISLAQVYGMDNYYRELYDVTKDKYLERPHPGECRRCGPSGKPAQPGSPRSKGHASMNAQRAISQAVLKDLWRASRALHGVTQANEDGFTSYADAPVYTPHGRTVLEVHRDEVFPEPGKSEP